MVRPDVFATKPTLTGERVRLVPLGPQHAEALHRFTTDPETRRLSGTHRSFARADIDEWCATRADQPDRLDLAIEATATGEMLGDLAVMDLDPPNAGPTSGAVSWWKGGSATRSDGTASGTTRW